MKKVLLLFVVSVLGIGLNQSCAQESDSKKKVEKELWVEDKDGELKVVITEKDGDKVSKEILTGADAEKYLEEKEGHNVMILKDGEHEGENVFIMKMGDGEGTNTWVTEEDFDFDFDFEFDHEELDKKLEALSNELDDLNKEEIAARLDEIMELKEETQKMHVIHMEKMHDQMDKAHEILEDIDIEVIEEDGHIIITKTVEGEKIVEEIKIDGDDKEKKVVVVKSINKDANSGMGSASMDNLNMNVYPNPNKGNFTIELDLKSDEMATVKVYDSSNKEVYSRTVKGIEKHKLDVKLKKATPGMYVVTVTQGNNKLKLKTIVE